MLWQLSFVCWGGGLSSGPAAASDRRGRIVDNFSFSYNLFFIAPPRPPRHITLKIETSSKMKIVLRKICKLKAKMGRKLRSMTVFMGNCDSLIMSNNVSWLFLLALLFIQPQTNKVFLYNTKTVMGYIQLIFSFSTLRFI